MPLLPEYQDVDMDNFFEELTSIKNTNLNNLRNSTVQAPNQAILPKIENPNKMEDFKEELIAIKQIATERKDATWTPKRQNSDILPFAIAGFIVYKFFL